MKKSMKKGLSLILTLCFLFSMMTVSAWADGEEGNSFTIETEFSEGKTFHIYQVAVADDSGKLTLTEDFEKYSTIEGMTTLETLDFRGGDEENVNKLRELEQTLAPYVQRDGIESLQDVATDQNGNAEVSGLADGIYLVIGDNFTEDGYIYTISPFMISLPIGSADQVIPKFERTKEDEETKEITVAKVWKNSNNQTQPEEITVQLTKKVGSDIEVEDEQVLNQENNWKYTWSELDSSTEWDVVEKEVPSGYTVSRTKDGSSIVITNTGTTTTPTPTTPPTLPHTGLLWWPVSILAALGIILICWGMVRRRRG